jgi:hypothetical protein
LIEAAHTSALGPRGLGQKSTDFSAIPLCAAHHREDKDSYHQLGESAFSLVHRLELSDLVAALQIRFWQRTFPDRRATTNAMRSENDGKLRRNR